jgi:hypothetical protein
VAKSVFTNEISTALESNRPYQGEVFGLGLPGGKKSGLKSSSREAPQDSEQEMDRPKLSPRFDLAHVLWSRCFHRKRS